MEMLGFRGRIEPLMRARRTLSRLEKCHSVRRLCRTRCDPVFGDDADEPDHHRSGRELPARWVTTPGCSHPRRKRACSWRLKIAASIGAGTGDEMKCQRLFCCQRLTSQPDAPTSSTKCCQRSADDESNCRLGGTCPTASTIARLSGC